MIPADRKRFRNVVVARIIVEHLEKPKLEDPKPTVELGRIRREYHAARNE